MSCAFRTPITAVTTALARHAIAVILIYYPYLGNRAPNRSNEWRSTKRFQLRTHISGERKMNLRRFINGILVSAGIFTGAVVAFPLGVNLGRGVPLATNPFAAPIESTRKVWTSAELKSLKGRSVEYLVQVLGKPWYEGTSFMSNTQFLKWKVAVRSKLTNITTDANITVEFNARHKATNVSIDGGLVN